MMRRSTKRIWLPIIVVGTMLVLYPVFLDLLKGSVAGVFSSFPPWIGIVGLVVTGVLGAASILWYDRLKSSLETSAATARENRQRMLDLVQNKWITGFLENSLYYNYHEHLLPLALRERVGSRLNLVLSNPLEPTQTISPGTPLAQVFDQARGELLILGEPGAGKTTLLLELARDLLNRVKENEAAPIPVVLMLASWATKKLPLEQWIVEELRMKYDVSSQIGEAWVKANQLLPLLDGLDEVASDAQPACIEAINGYYHQAHRSVVVCSRTTEYLKQPGRLALHTAVTVQPLSSEQIGIYLDGLAAKGEEIEGLKRALHQSATLSALEKTPLYLTVLILAYHGKPVQELLALGKEAPMDQLHLLFHNYVEQVLQRKGTRIHALAQQTSLWLAWLARQLKAHQQYELYLEQLQPDWLPKGQRALYQWSIGLVFGVVFGPLFGLLIGLFFGSLFGVWIGLLIGLFFGLFSGLYLKIEPVEAITWSWKGQGVGLVVGTATGLAAGLTLAVGQGVGLAAGLLFGVWVGLVVGLVVRLVVRFWGKHLTRRSILSPNEWIRRSVKSGLAVGLAVGLFVGLVFAPLFGLIFGLFGWLFFGLPIVQHYTLRFWLWRMHLFPWRAVPFLDDAVEQLILRKVGGGYIFRHRLLQDYFASLETPPSEEVSTASASLQKPDEKEELR